MDAWAQPREAAVAEPGAERAVGAAERDAALQPGVAEAVRDAVLRRAAPVVSVRLAAGPLAAPSAFHRDQALPWLAP